ncbi:PAS domain-containing methyl-accepting chemotaxis protein [uncultured Ferrimonas sp.]|uniref:methyl-accepting chemotaxis protein n=1 Tax=uncultured Ferrimonas sp. TaxID=432640 RepID=UPI0026327897|nr:PAS domain-containing methyl-accepting chemotaxis protein [uncultured Ferrimonas sp.]
MRNNQPVTQQQQNYADDRILLSTTDPQGVIKYANQDFVEVSGYSLSQLQGQNHNMIRHPDMPAAAFASLWGNMKQGKPWFGIVKNRCANGDHYWVNAYVTPVMEGNQIHELQSVRRRPKPHLVARAERIYADLNANKTPKAMRRPWLSFQQRLLVAAGLGSVGTAALALVSPYLALLGSGITVALLAWLLRPLQPLVNKSKQIIDDPLAQAVFSGRQDELGQIELAMAFLGTELGGVVGRIADSAGSLQTMGSTMLDTVQHTQQRAAQQSDQTAAAATAVEQMSVSFSEVADNSSAMASALDQSLTVAAEGSEVLRQVTESIDNLSGEVGRITNEVAAIERDSSAISEVLNVIRGIADQTNLLALNAAIEAARAGESGRGFAVVADEVRNLAQRTAESTVQIEQIVSQFQSSSRAASSAMNQGQQSAQDTVALTRAADQAFASLQQAVTHINGMSGEIAAAMSQQHTVTEDISRAISNITDLAQDSYQQSSKTVEQGGAMARLTIKQAELSQQFWQLGVARGNE